MSKGSRPRPYSVDLNTFNNNWDSIFKKNQVDEDKQPLSGTSRIESSTIDIDTEVKDSNHGG